MSQFKNVQHAICSFLIHNKDAETHTKTTIRLNRLTSAMDCMLYEYKNDENTICRWCANFKWYQQTPVSVLKNCNAISVCSRYALVLPSCIQCHTGLCQKCFSEHGKCFKCMNGDTGENALSSSD